MAGLRPQCLMLDANVIICLHERGLWSQIKAAFEVCVPSIIAREASYFIDEHGQRQRIDLLGQIALGELTELTAALVEMAALVERFDADLLEGLHAGEQEAIALISRTFAAGSFCTGDNVPMEALATLALHGRLVSLENVLVHAGCALPQGQRLEKQYTQSFLDGALKRGRQRRITGQGLRKSLWDRL